ncbi:DUF3810 domain-containing protein [Labilibacter sediminis]|nr:DUF3810 domain-containing protein [Labilibacter sediminis]
MQIVKKHFKKYFLFILALITLLVLFLFKSYPLLAERIYSNGIYPVVAAFLSSVSRLFPFSLDDFFYLGLILLFCLGIVLLVLRRISLGSFLFRIAQLLAMVFVLFYWSWGFNYYRADVHTRMELHKNLPDTEVFIEVFEDIIEQANNSYVDYCILNHDELDSCIEASFSQISDELKLKYSQGYRRVKEITLSSWFAKATILGYYGPFFNEVHINSYLTGLDVPVVMAHEKAHQFGITGEAEASFYGWLVCVKSNQNFVRYSGWMYALDYFLFESRDLPNRKELIEKIRPEVIEDLKYRYQYWHNWRNEKMDRVARKMNDVYLKTNGVESGIDDYGDMVQLIVDYQLKIHREK